MTWLIEVGQFSPRAHAWHAGGRRIAVWDPCSRYDHSACVVTCTHTHHSSPCTQSHNPHRITQAACPAAAAAAPSSAAKLGPAVATGGAAVVSSVVDCDDALPLARFGRAAADALALARDCAARIARVISSSSSSSSSSPSSSHAIEAAAPNTAPPEPPDARGLSTVIWRACTDSDADGCTLLAV